ncbi:DNA (cytosine-5-)-methyltransferase [Paenibacillus roseus]|uniref:Cytosine-specific methyltransferase n=1 Tax=Paenibacillus roseus TaxID=2798579 RepID=A0A934J4U0_9BACL|nr:DNA (cytosine-5-)-methyltransferase [Paenibacillus roseus]MBJ6360358.1 DNA (cytosine-5-)-methyltransferase [Paenibacillus roseus]
MARKIRTQINYHIKRPRIRMIELKSTLCTELDRRGLTTYSKNNYTVYGKPDFVFAARKVAIFCNNEFSRGYSRGSSKGKINDYRMLGTSKFKNIERDRILIKQLQRKGWTVLRFQENQIKTNVAECVDEIERHLRFFPQRPYRTIDLCAGIGGIRRGFELAGEFVNVLSAEIDKYACMTYKHLFGEDPSNDLTSKAFKERIERTPYDILLAGFPCQTFSRVGLGEGFENEEKGQVFFHIADIIKRTRPCAFFLENVDHLVTRDKGATFRRIIDTLVTELKYRVIGVSLSNDGVLNYSPRDFVRNSRNFGVPQNRPRTYIIGFDRERFKPERLLMLPTELPRGREHTLYTDLNAVLERDVDLKYYMASGYLETLIKHRERQEGRGYGFGYRIVNEPGIETPIANTLLATGGSGRERNLLYDPRDGAAGTIVKGKKTPLNDKGIRKMTPTEWGKLQGFINYAFMKENGAEGFSFPNRIPDVQKYKQFGNSVTIPAVEEMARFMRQCLEILCSTD